jgi:hypothetical protein
MSKSNHTDQTNKASHGLMRISPKTCCARAKNPPNRSSKGETGTTQQISHTRTNTRSTIRPELKQAVTTILKTDGNRDLGRRRKQLKKSSAMRARTTGENGQCPGGD